MKKIIILLLVILFSTVANAQWIGPFNGNLDNTNITDGSNNIVSVGIGDFRAYNSWTKAALDITIPFSPTNPQDWVPTTPYSVPLGEAIHTSVLDKFDHAWRMYTMDNVNVHPGIEKFNIFNIGNDYLNYYSPSFPHISVNDIQLRVVQKGNLDFYTDNNHWMELTPSGNLGLSNEWRSFTPDEQFHQNDSRNTNVFHHFTNGRTGLGDSRGFKVGLYDNPTFNWSEAHFEQWHYAPIITMLANSSGAYKERIKVWQGLGGDQVGGWANTPDITKISINHGLGNSGAVDYSPMPVCMLNIGRRGASGNQAGNRAWMDVGTYYNFDSDNMYVGLKDDGPNRKDAPLGRMLCEG